MAASTSAAQREINIAQIRENLFPPSTTTAAVAPRIPIIDSHIHLYPSSEESTLAWLPTPPTDPPHPLAGQHSLDEYTAATHAPRELEGFVFLETDRINDLESGAKDGSGWKYPLMEVEWLKRIALGTPKPGEGHDEKQKELCLAIIPWAPLPSGVEAMEKYLELVAESAGESFDKIRGFRYLVQHKPQGTMLGDGFIESLKWLGRKGYVFDHGVDSHRGGDWQLDETVEMIKRAHEGVEEKDKVVFIINHLCKPDLTLSQEEDVTENPKFQAWREAIFKLSRCSRTYMKLSGSFSEISESLQKESGDEIFKVMQPWLIVLLATFGASRTMFGSDWPVCMAGTGDGAWIKWRYVVERLCDLAGFTLEDNIMLWSGTAIKAYGIESLM